VKPFWIPFTPNATAYFALFGLLCALPPQRRLTRWGSNVCGNPPILCHAPKP
jgi:hypothetical protein